MLPLHCAQMAALLDPVDMRALLDVHAHQRCQVSTSNFDCVNFKNGSLKLFLYYSCQKVT